MIGRGASVVDDQRTGSGHGLEPDVAVVEICSCKADWGTDLIVEEMEGWDGPLGGEGGAVAEGGDGQGEAVPMLCHICQSNVVLALIVQVEVRRANHG